MPDEPRCKKVCSYALPIDDVDYHDYANVRTWWHDAGVEAHRQRGAQRAAQRDKRDDVLRRKKIAAQQAVQVAVRDGRLHRGPCEVCGTTEDICGHHDDYDKPLEVRWLCREHHADLHGWTPEDSAMLAVGRAIDKLRRADDDYFRPSKELADLQQQMHRLQRQKDYRRGYFWMPYSHEAETKLENAGAEYGVSETAEGKMIDYFEATEVKP